MTRRRLTGALAVALAAVAAGPASLSASSGLGPLIVEPDQGYAPIYALIGSARHTLDLTIYELGDPQAQQALIADAARGVRVRVLLDEAMSGGPFNRAAFADLKTHGVDVRWASTRVSITHQKSFVIDRKKAVIMTGNLTSKYYATSRDYAIADTKKKDVAAVEATFELDWTNAEGVPPTGADLLWSPGSEARLVSLIASAKHTLRVENEEMKEPAIQAALAAAAKRGVGVDLLMMNQKSWRPAFDALKAAGVHVRTYKLTAAIYIHAKAIVVDSKRVFLGSQNFSVRSLEQNRELGLITTAKALVAAVRTTFDKDFGGATAW